MTQLVHSTKRGVLRLISLVGTLALVGWVFIFGNSSTPSIQSGAYSGLPLAHADVPTDSSDSGNDTDAAAGCGNAPGGPDSGTGGRA